MRFLRNPERAARIVGALCSAGLFCGGLLGQNPPAMVDYAKQVHPILAERCFSCHSAEKRSGGLSLATYADVLEGGRSGAAIRPGNSKDSLLIDRVSGEMKPQMPLGQPPLSDAELAVIRSWIDQGARETPTSAPAKPKWEAPLELHAPGVPQSPWPEWNSPLDRFVASYLASHGVSQPQVVSDRIFARRVYLDIWGLLPSPEQLKSFVADKSPDKRRKLVESLLANNKNYAENWISFWNDLLRNDEGVNYAGSRKSITKWLLGSLEQNTPYDQLVTKLLNPVEPSDPEGFLIGVNWRGDISASQTPAMQAAQNSAQVFLGINLKCNSCHDSFISRWKLKDAYSLAAYFSEEPKLEMYRCDAKTGQFAEPGFLYPQLSRTPASESLADRHAAAAAMFTDPRNGRLPRTLVNRYWERLMGRGIVEPVDDMDAEPWSPELLDWLASDFVAHNYDLKHLIATIVTSRAYQMPSVVRKGEQPREYVFQGPEIRRISAEQFADAVGAITGEWRVYAPDSGKQGVYTREWRVISSPLTRALGRPIRDQVITERENQATMLQALELVNGATLTHWLNRGALRMLNQLPPEPASLFDSGVVRGSSSDHPPRPVQFDIDISNANELWLLTADWGSYAADRVEAVWANAELVGPSGAVPLKELKPAKASGLRNSAGPIEIGHSSDWRGVRVMLPSQLMFDIRGKGFTRFRGVVSIEDRCLTSDIMPMARFFVFDQEPNLERLIPVSPETPVPPEASPRTTTEAVNRVYMYALGRLPLDSERQLAEQAVDDPAKPGHPCASGLADLMWAVLMSPEFQLIL